MQGVFKNVDNIIGLDNFIWDLKHHHNSDRIVNTKHLDAKVVFYSEDGKKYIEVISKQERLYYTQVWNEMNEPLLIKGTGIYKYQEKDLQETVYQVFKDSSLVQYYSFRYNNSDTLQYLYDESAEPAEGITLYSHKLKRLIKNPTRLPKVYSFPVRFIVEKDGTLTNIEILEGGDTQLGKNINEVLASSEKWVPAVWKNRPVRQRVSMMISMEHLRPKRNYKPMLDMFVFNFFINPCLDRFIPILY